MYEGNPGEIDFGSSYIARGVRVSEGSSYYRESTVHIFQYHDLDLNNNVFVIRSLISVSWVLIII